LQQKSFEEWLEEFRNIIMNAIKSETLYKQLVGFVNEVIEANYLLKSTGPARAQFVAPGQELEPFVLRTKPATPERIRFIVRLGDWAFRPREILGIDRVGRFVARRENLAIVKGLLSGAGNEIMDGHSKERFREAINWIDGNGYYPDRMLVHPQDLSLLEKEGITVPIRHLPQGLGEQKASRFCTISEGGLDVCWISLIERGTAIIYEKAVVKMNFKTAI